MAPTVRRTDVRAQELVREVNAPGELSVDSDLVKKFTDRGYQVDGEGRDQIVLSRPGSNRVLKIVGTGHVPRQQAVKRYVEFFQQHQDNPHFPRVGQGREIRWEGERYYIYTQERLHAFDGGDDGEIRDYLEDLMGGLAVGNNAVDERDIPAGLTYEQVEDLAQAVTLMLKSGLGAGQSFDLANTYNIMQRPNSNRLVIVDPFADSQEVNEVKILSRIKGKGSEPSQLPRFGRAIEPEKEEYYLGKRVGKFAGYTIWRDWVGGQLGYHLFDPRERRVVITTFGSQYKGNPRSYIIHGLYAAPGNPVKAHQFYRNLIVDQGLTLISDRKQSPGGNRVWQRLEAYPDINVYGYDTKTGEMLNFGARDAEMYAIPARAAKNPETKYIANNIRLVATAR